MTVAGRTIGFALGGGAVRGAAHIGVAKVLAAHGIRPDYVAGTSVGAIVGAGIACGASPESLQAVFERMGWTSLVRPTLHLKTSLVDSSRLARRLREELGLTSFEALEIPFAAVCCDLRAGEVVVLDRGDDVAAAVRASAALPGVFEPERDGERLLVDGGILENLPTRVVREMGADYVIGVDLLPKGEILTDISNLLEIWQRSLYLLIANNHTQGNADLVLAPDIAGFSFTDFQRVGELVAKGEKAALAALPRLRQDLGLAQG